MQLYRWGPLGGPGGVDFDETDALRDLSNVRLSRITVRHGAWIDAIATTIAVDGVDRSAVTHGGAGGTATEIVLAPDERIVSVRGRCGVYVDSLVIRTSRGTEHIFGGAGGIYPFAFDCDAGSQIVGFCGRSGMYLDALGVIAAPIALTDYDLKIDDQTDRFLAFKHQLTYFVVTAAVAPIGFVISLIVQAKPPLQLWPGQVLLWLGGVAGLVAAGATLVGLQNEIASHREHIRARYERKSYDDLDQARRARWDRFIGRARRFSSAAVVSLIAEIALISLFCGFLIAGGRLVSGSSTTVTISGSSANVTVSGPTGASTTPKPRP